MRIIQVLLLACCLVALVAASAFDCETAPADPQDRRRDTSKLRVATFNCEWLFLNAPNCPGDGCSWPTYEDAVLHIKTIAANIRELDADIVNLVEIQDCDVLRMLNEEIGEEYRYRYYLTPGTDTSTHQNVALLTRVDPVVNLQRYEISGADVRQNYPITGSKCGYTGAVKSTTISKHYWTRVMVNGMPITLVGVHYIAIPTDPIRCSQREAQANITASLVNSQLSIGADAGEIMVMGDFNDYDGAVLDVKGDVPTSNVLGIVKQPGLVTAASAVTNVSSRYSDWYDVTGHCQLRVPQDVSTIDHILMTQGLYSKLTYAEYAHIYTKRCDPENYESDHWPMVVDFDV